jgi:hypothetical protein
MFPGPTIRSCCTALLFTALLAGCGSDDPLGPVRGVMGQYRPSTWTVTPAGGTTTDVLAAGGQLPLYLDGQGLAIGRMIVPAGVANVDPVNLYFDGPYEVSGGVVRVRADEDVFVRDLPLAVQGTTLVGDATFGGTRVRLTFTRIPTP